jgi:signal recognition particle receptor subunit beta
LELRPRDRIVQLKFVYYGPAVCGKTTNLQMLHAAALARHRGELITVNSQQERTILFDLLPLRGVGFHGFDVRFQLVAVPGQAPYAATRRLVMRGTDAVVFVANSAADRLEENCASYVEMCENLKAIGRDPETLPLVFQFNKRDLPEISSIEQLSLALNRRGVPELEAVAFRGDGVLETIGTLMASTMAELTTRYQSMALGRDETVQTWAWGAIQQVFGRSTLAGEGLRPSGQDDDLRRVQVAVPKVPRGAASADVDKALVGSYVETSLSLSEALDTMRQERDEARRRLHELDLTVQAIEELSDGKPPGDTLRAALSHLVAAAGCSRGSLIAPGPDQKLKLLASIGMTSDPFVNRPEGYGIVKERFLPLAAPSLSGAEQAPEVASVLRSLEPPAVALAAAPVRSGFGLHGMALFYLGPTDPLPPPSSLGHLSLMSRALGAWFVVRRGQTQDAAAPAPHGALPEIERVMRLVAELLRAAAREPQKAAQHLDKASRTLDSIALLTSGLSASEHSTRPEEAP